MLGFLNHIYLNSLLRLLIKHLGMFERTEVELLISLLEDYPNSTFLGELISIFKETLSKISSELFISEEY